MEIIKIENLTFTYPNMNKPSLDKISLTVNQGEFITICGKSGCGKSTLLRHLKPILSPHGERNGSIYFEGKDINLLSQREQAEKIGFVFQNPDNQLVTDKVWHELAFGLESLSFPNAEIRGRVAEMASFFGIGEWFYKDVSELSGGQKQLLNLASVMVMQPSVLILDEPTSQLDPIAAQDFLHTVLKINRELGTTVILTQHRLEEAFPISDRVVFIDGGKIIACAPPCEVGQILSQTDDDMFFALPTPMRVFFSVNSSMKCPVTVGQGRQWLLNMPVNKNVVFNEKTVLDSEIILKLDDIWFRYEKDLPDVLKGLSLSVHKGEFYAVLGGNGTGKTTALSVILRVYTPYRGKVFVKDGIKIAALAQNPQSLFVKKTVRLDLYDMLADEKISEDEKESRINSVIDFCSLSDLLERHPYDLSGGEQQKAALAKVLLIKPDILLLDEPTKGLDAHFKEKLAVMFCNLLQSGVSIVMVSHDIEFCAKYADRCGMFFDGKITDEETARKFFSGKSFYTTAANRMSRGILTDAVLDTDIISALGGTAKQMVQTENKHEKNEQKTDNTNEKSSDKRIKTKNIFLGSVFALLFCMVQWLYVGKYKDFRQNVFQILSIIFIGLSLFSFIGHKRLELKSIQVAEKNHKISKRTLASALMILLLIPLTIFIGVYFLDDKKYYFISLLVILETMIPFALVFEGRHPQARYLVIISVLCAIAVAGRAAFYMLPQFKPVVALVIISGVAFGGETGFLVGAVTGFVSNFFFGQGPWTPWQMFAFGIIGFLGGVLFTKGILRKTKAELCVFGFLSTLVIYGVIMNTASVILWQPNPNLSMFLSAFAMGFPLDMVHAVSTAFFLFFLSEPMLEKLDRIKVKYGFI